VPANKGDFEMAVETDQAPRELVARLMDGYLSTQLIHIAAQLDLAGRLADGPRSSSELAEMTGAHPSALHRILRGLVIDGVLDEDATGKFILTDAGRCLDSRRADSMRGAVMARGEMYYPAAGALIETVRSGEPAFRHANGVDFFEAITGHPDRVAAFQQSMTVRSQQEADELVEVYPFSSFNHIVDVGGGRGVLLATILKAYPKLRGTLLDRPDVVSDSHAVLDAAGVASRCAVVPGDFFSDLPAGGDVYLLSRVIHDWDDAAAIRILRSCRKAMSDAGVLVLVEAVLPRRARDLPAAIRMDLHMLTLLKGKERTLEEFEHLLVASGFNLQRIVQTDGRTGISALEARPSSRGSA
jgi:O-methyltransferase domain